MTFDKENFEDRLDKVAAAGLDRVAPGLGRFHRDLMALIREDERSPTQEPAARGAFQLPPDLLETIEEQAERAERERVVKTRRARAKRLCGLAVLAVDSLREGSPKLRQEVEAAIHDVGAGVEALACFETAVRHYQEPTAEQRQAAARVIEHAPLGWALDQVEKLVRAEARERESKRR